MLGLMCSSQLGSATELEFGGMDPPNLEDARRLGRCLNHCRNLTRLNLSNAGLDDRSFRAFLSELDDCSLPTLRQFELQGNMIGWKAYDEALARGVAQHSICHAREAAREQAARSDERKAAVARHAREAAREEAARSDERKAAVAHAVAHAMAKREERRVGEQHPDEWMKKR